ncbi:MAG: class I SAM-dependent methyltransferase [Actinomycetota bacterium]|nr:class I SAM-dependent methyltransferase [Actinomycetota bacterium]
MTDPTIAGAQQGHWASTFAANPDMYGTDPSVPAVAAAASFTEAGAHQLLELGAGQGRDTLFFARQGFEIVALDYVEDALDAIAAKATAAGTGDTVGVALHDVREPLPFADGAFDANYSHMLFCMALTTAQLEQLAAELHRVLRPGGLVVYTVRHTGDAHYGTGTPRGDDMYERGGFIVHFFDDRLVQRLATGFDLLDVTEFTEGDLPRRLWRVTMRKPGHGQVTT